MCTAIVWWWKAWLAAVCVEGGFSQIRSWPPGTGHFVGTLVKTCRTEGLPVLLGKLHSASPETGRAAVLTDFHRLSCPVSLQICFIFLLVSLSWRLYEPTSNPSNCSSWAEHRINSFLLTMKPRASKRNVNTSKCCIAASLDSASINILLM